MQTAAYIDAISGRKAHRVRAEAPAKGQSTQELGTG